MILSTVNFFSKALKTHEEIRVLLPSVPDGEAMSMSYDALYPGKTNIPVLWLLHGALDDGSAWLRKTTLERLLEDKNIAAVLPSGRNSFYTDEKQGDPYFEYITQELPALLRHLFPLSPRREDNFIAGASMGGYGAARCALLCPEHYAAFGSFSGAPDIKELERGLAAAGLDLFRFDLVFGGADAVKGTDSDLSVLAHGLSSAAVKPAAYLTCGTQETINYPMNLAFRDTLVKNCFSVRYEDGPWNHDWENWDNTLKGFIDFICNL